MPDDLEQVAEPEVTETVEPEDVLKNETDAFEVDDEVAEDVAEPEPKNEPEKPEETGEPEKEDPEKTVETGEDDEDLKRGREILDAKRAEEEQKKQEESGETQDDEPVDLRKETFTAETVAKIAEFVPKNLLPNETVKLPDGTELDFKTVENDYPEIKHMVALYANNIIRQMVTNGFLVSGERLQDFDKTIDRRAFVRTVTHPQYGVPQADKIVKSDEYKSWVEKQPPEIQVLRESGNPFDMIRVLKRFQGQGILGDAKKDAEKVDKQRQEKKATFDAAHKTTKKNKGTPSRPKTETVDSKAEEMEAFLSDDDD